MHRLCDTKIGDLCTTFAIDQNVPRRHVTMNDAAHMCSGESTSNLCSNCRSTTWHEWTNAPQHGGEIFSVDKLHHDGWRFAFWCNIKHSGNVGVRDDGGGATFSAEAVSGGGRCCERRAKHLNGHVATERLIGGAEDKCRRPFPNQLLQPIATSNDVAGLQRSLVTI
jgi:hypothetical protein